MIVDHVEDDGDSVTMGGLDQLFKGLRTAIILFDGKRKGRVISPGKAAGKFRGGHDLDGIDAQLCQVGQLFNNPAKVARPAARLVVEGADVHFVNDQLVPARHAILGRAPIELPLADQRIADRAGGLPGVGVDAPQVLISIQDQVAVFMAGLGAGHIGRPIAVPLVGQRVLPLGPIVEGASHVHLVGVGRPHAEGCPPRVGHGTHAGARRGAPLFSSRPCFRSGSTFHLFSSSSSRTGNSAGGRPPALFLCKGLAPVRLVAVVVVHPT